MRKETRRAQKEKEKQQQPKKSFKEKLGEKKFDRRDKKAAKAYAKVNFFLFAIGCMYTLCVIVVCVCVCERERERERRMYVLAIYKPLRVA